MNVHRETLENGTVITLEEGPESEWVHLRVSNGNVHRGLALRKDEARVAQKLFELVRIP